MHDGQQDCADSPTFDLDFCKARVRQLLATNPALALIGFYVIGPDVERPGTIHAELARQLAPLCDGAALLLFDPTALAQPALDADKRAFVAVYEVPLGDAGAGACAPEAAQCLFEGNREAAGRSLRKTQMEIAMDEMERITLDHIISEAGAAGSKSETAEHRYRLQAARQRRAVEELLRRTQHLKDYVAEVRAGAVPRDETLLRSLMSFCRHLSTCRSLPSSLSRVSPLPSSSPSCCSPGETRSPAAALSGPQEARFASMDVDTPDATADLPSASKGDFEKVSETLRELALLPRTQHIESAAEATRDAVMSQMAVLLSSMTDAVGAATRTHEKFLLARASHTSNSRSLAQPAERSGRRSPQAW
ncbi:conserved hypothetical protein [Neospora caninum Liverpool]|nr:conserved hypothetical protein [Neospora caninum Liverpool]CBZ54106.1 conserved hypothetical protein [Neospora caninum Liverpool]|eukprot:XP_003884137.1 conserved hypothetical protein [Neospora caninum Liverpool]